MTSQQGNQLAKTPVQHQGLYVLVPGSLLLYLLAIPVQDGRCPTNGIRRGGTRIPLRIKLSWVKKKNNVEKGLWGSMNQDEICREPIRNVIASTHSSRHLLLAYFSHCTGKEASI